MNTNADINQKLHEAMGRECWHSEEDKSTWLPSVFVSGRTVPPLPFKRRCLYCGASDVSFGVRGNMSYDSDLNAAFDLVEFMRKEKGASVEIYVYPSGYAARVIVGEKLYGEQSDESVPRAISLAAIRALEVK